MQNWTQNFKGLLNLFLESNCPLCQRPTAKEFCQDCTTQLQRCKLPQSSYLWQGKLPVFAWGTYGGTLKRAIASLKYENQPQIARPLGYWLAQAWLNSQLASNQLSVVPIPLHVDKQKQRGYNQAALLAQSFCDLTGLQLQQQGLERIRGTEAQFGLSVSEREKNLAMAFQAGPEFRRYRPAKPVLLLDDIYTTGATARSAAQTLRALNIRVYGVVAIAASQKQA
ncbi:ComF family protein [Chroococcidiopsis sp. CCMEE 29]|uniref:ComF family protein n=1 Tax=Chroococcidiopsis sp. CCMEE 29 TaxID=155894 RepID=UPI00201FCF98|nr:ComF family protein [Chroococcidiopsis sp. CCMEE 29]